MRNTGMEQEEKLYDLIIIGAGAAGLFAGASLVGPVNGLILEKKPFPGKKLLMSGSGQCNLTHGGSIKAFIEHYGENGSRIRPVLYRFNNLAVMDFFRKNGVPLFERADGKVFPKSLNARDVLSVLNRGCTVNGLEFIFSSPVTAITVVAKNQQLYTVHCGEKRYRAKHIILSTGGCSYPATGSDGQFFSVLERMGVRMIPPRPALVPIYVEAYPYRELAGISFLETSITIKNQEATRETKKTTGDLLFAHDCFSGPAVLNASRYARPGDELWINYIPSIHPNLLKKECLQAARGNRRKVSTLLFEILNGTDKSPASLAVMPKRFLDVICLRANVDPTRLASTLSGADLASIIGLLTQDRFPISGTGGYGSAMVTAGGVSLDEVHMKTMEAIKYPGIYFAGELLDVDGDTGGYNLQFAFSSGYIAARNISFFINSKGSGTETEHDTDN